MEWKREQRHESEPMTLLSMCFIFFYRSICICIQWRLLGFSSSSLCRSRHISRFAKQWRLSAISNRHTHIPPHTCTHIQMHRFVHPYKLWIKFALYDFFFSLYTSLYMLHVHDNRCQCGVLLYALLNSLYNIFRIAGQLAFHSPLLLAHLRAHIQAWYLYCAMICI